MDKFSVRKATFADIPDLVKLRRLMFESMGYTDSNDLRASDLAVEEYFKSTIPTGTFQGWIAESSTGEILGSGGVVIDQHPPGPNNFTGKIAYIMNLCTYPEHRQRGIGRRIMEEIITWIKQANIEQASLHATDIGKRLYLDLGFNDSNEMRMNVNS
jgi:ribosomal protein S18 acetylase RimI-like enzyme